MKGLDARSNSLRLTTLHGEAIERHLSRTALDKFDTIVYLFDMLFSGEVFGLKGVVGFAFKQFSTYIPIGLNALSNN